MPQCLETNSARASGKEAVKGRSARRLRADRQPAAKSGRAQRQARTAAWHAKQKLRPQEQQRQETDADQPRLQAPPLEAVPLAKRKTPCTPSSATSATQPTATGAEPQQGVAVRPQACPAGCGPPTAGGEGPSGARPQPMHACACSPRGGASHGSSQPPRGLWPVACPESSHGCAFAAHAPCDIETCLAQLREQQFVPFMQFHMQQGMPEHTARAAWGAYEQRRMSELCVAPT